MGVLSEKENGLMLVSEEELFANVVAIIENRKGRASAATNSEATLMFWEAGYYISSVLLGNERATYGKRIVATLSSQLEKRYGSSFTLPNVRRMMRFSQRITDKQIVTTLSSQLSWSHVIELLPLKNVQAQLFYAEDVANRGYQFKKIIYLENYLY